jgi:hypothetical protein
MSKRPKWVIETKLKDVKLLDKFNKLTLLEKILQKDNIGHLRTYFKCLCDCGNEKIINWQCIKSGCCVSCGCHSKETASKLFRKEQGKSAFNHILYTYTKSAKNKNLIFDLDEETFKELITSNCHYCNAIPSTICKRKTALEIFIYNGIDRVDNSKGYYKENCVTCCEQCNRMKLDYSLKEFINKISDIYNNCITKNKYNGLS